MMSQSVAVTAAQDLVNLGGAITARDNLIAQAGGNLTVQSTTRSAGSSAGRSSSSLTQIDRVAGLYVTAADDLVASAGRDMSITEGRATADSDDARYAKSSGFMSSSSIEMRRADKSDTAVASQLGGSTVTVQSGRDTLVRGSNIVSDEATAVVAGRDLTIEAATNTRASSSFSETKKSGVFGGGGLGVTIGKQRATGTQTSESTTAAASTVGSIGGDVTLAAGRSYRQTGSDVLAPAGDINVAARDVQITEARETSTATTEQRFKQSGVTLAVSTPILEIQFFSNSQRTTFFPTGK